MFTTRLGGVSVGSYLSLNLASHVGDASAAVATNRRRCVRALGITPGRLAEAEQVHGSGVGAVGKNAPAPSAPRVPLPGVDALVTAVPGVWLAVYSADCVPVLLLDAASPAVAAIHAGWRGTAAGIVEATLLRMRELFGTAPGRCTAVLGPAIGGCCYEVDTPVAEAMRGGPWWPEAARPTGPERWHLDLRVAIRRQLTALGVPDEGVTSVPHCTACRADLFFSHRRDGVTGRMGAYVCLTG